EIKYQAVAVQKTNDQGEIETNYVPITKARPLKSDESPVTKTFQMATSNDLEVGDEVAAHLELGKYRYLDADKRNRLAQDNRDEGKEPKIIHGTVKDVKENEVEITVSWFSILNSFFIIAFSS